MTDKPSRFGRIADKMTSAAYSFSNPLPDLDALPDENEDQSDYEPVARGSHAVEQIARDLRAIKQILVWMLVVVPAIAVITLVLVVNYPR